MLHAVYNICQSGSPQTRYGCVSELTIWDGLPAHGFTRWVEYTHACSFNIQLWNLDAFSDVEVDPKDSECR